MIRARIPFAVPSGHASEGSRHPRLQLVAMPTGSDVVLDPRCLRLGHDCSALLFRDVGGWLAVVHRLQHLLRWIGCGCADGQWGKPNLEAWRHIALTTVIGSEANQLATRLHGTGVKVSTIHGHHRTEVGRHIALTTAIVSKAHQLATRLHGTCVTNSGSHGHDRTEVGRHIALTRVIAPEANKLAQVCLAPAATATTGPRSGGTPH